MDIRDVARIIRDRWVILVIGLVVAATFGWLTAPPDRAVEAATSYDAEAAVLLSPSSPLPMSYIILYGQQGEVPARVAERLGEPDQAQYYAALMRFTEEPSSPVLKLSATGPSGVEVTELVNVYADELVKYIAELEGQGSEAQAEALEGTLDVLQGDLARAEAALAEDSGNVVLQAQADALRQRYQAAYQQLTDLLRMAPGESLKLFRSAVAIPVTSGGFTISANPLRRAGMFGVAALFVVGLLLFVLDRLDRRLRTRGQVEAAFGLPTLAVVPSLPIAGAESLPITLLRPSSPEADTFRGLRSVLQSTIPHFIDTERPAHRMPLSVGNRVVMIVAPRAGSGVTTLVSNLCTAFSESGSATLVADGNLADPGLSAQLEVGPPGLVDVLTNPGEHPVAGIESLIHPTPIPKVDAIGAGSPGVYKGAEPSRVKASVEFMRSRAEITLVDGAPMLEGVESLDLMPFVDGVVIVARLGRTTRDDAEHVEHIIARLGVPCLGVVVNEAWTTRRSWRAWVPQRSRTEAEPTVDAVSQV